MSIPAHFKSMAETVKLTGHFGLIAGLPGAGKTWLLRTIPNLSRCLVMNFEHGLRSVADVEGVQVATYTRVTRKSHTDTTPSFEADLDWLEREGAGQYDFIFIDTLSELMDLVMNECGADEKDYFKPYRFVNKKMSLYLGKLRALPMSVICTAGISRNIDTDLMEIAAPGSKLSSKIPHSFDFVAALQTQADDTGNIKRRLQLQPGHPWAFCKARDPHNRLAQFEAADLGALFTKLQEDQANDRSQ